MKRKNLPETLTTNDCITVVAEASSALRTAYRKLALAYLADGKDSSAMNALEKADKIQKILRGDL